MPDAPPEAPPYRLPRTVLPRRYELTLTPDLTGASFAGEERVEVTVTEPVTQVVLNAAELEILTAELVSADGARITGTVTLDPAEERATIALDGTADPGTWHLHLTFTGVLNDKLVGFYRSTYRGTDGTEQVIATTQFEATHARRAFPCWDEPDMKATFKVALVVDDGLTAISNGAVMEVVDQGTGKQQVEFTETMVMSTYLVAFVVGKFDVTEPVVVDGVPLRVAAPPGRINLSAFALEVGEAALRYFGAYFDIPYPADKLDLIAVPDFAFGAMENLGAVVFRETALLVDPATASRLELERVADVVSHEIAHMWFGDLVTMKWWNGIWLNEAFATFMELLNVDQFRPDWQRWVSFAVSREEALAIDGLTTTRPVEFPVGRPEEAVGMFDVLTYQKGGAVLRMLEQYLGAEPFRQGIARYLAAHAHGNTETTDLWDAIEEASGEPARATMDSWIYQGGYPLVSVARGPDGSVTLSQRRFLYTAADGAAADGAAAGAAASAGAGERWKVPVMLRAGVAGGGEKRQSLLLSEEAATVALPADAEWVVVNDGAWGFYRVRYDSALLRRLTADIGATLVPLERFALVGDTWAAALAGQSPVSDYVGLVRHLRAETDPDVWGAMLGPLRLFDRILPGAQRAAVQDFVRALVSPAVELVGWDKGQGETERTGTLRATLIGALGTLGADPATVERARQLHASYLLDRSAVDPDLVSAVVNILAYNGDDADFDTCLDRFRHPADPQEEVRYLYALGRFQDTTLLRRALDLSLSGEVRTQNAPYVVGVVLANRADPELGWRFVEEHWDTMLERFPENSIARMIEGISAQAHPGLARSARDFLATHPVRQGDRLVAQTLETLDVHVAFAQREGPGLPAALGTAAGG